MRLTDLLSFFLRLKIFFWVIKTGHDLIEINNILIIQNILN
jgi:hypothetical protein